MNTSQERKQRRDTGQPLWTERDIAALTWIANQYAVGLDQLQVLLGHLSRQEVGLTKTRALVTRWGNAG